MEGDIFGGGNDAKGGCHANSVSIGGNALTVAGILVSTACNGNIRIMDNALSLCHYAVASYFGSGYNTTITRDTNCCTISSSVL